MKAIRSSLAILISLALVALSPGWGCYQAMAAVVGAAASVTAAPGAQAGAVGAAGAMNAGPAVSNLAPMRLDLSGGMLQPTLAKPDLRGVQPQVSALPSAAPAAVRLPVSAAAAQQAAPAPVQAAPTVNASRAPPMSPIGTVEAHRTAPGAAAAAAPVNVSQSATPLKALARVSKAEEKYFGAAAAKAREQGVKTAFQGLQQPLPASIGSMSPAKAASVLHDDFLSRIGAHEGAGVRSFASAVMPQGSPFARLQPAALSRGAAAKRDEGRSVPSVEREDSRNSGPDGTGDLDELGNPRRHQDPGPDSVSDSGGRGFSESGGGGRGNSDLFALAAPVLGTLAVAGGLAAFAPAALVLVPLYLGIVIPSLVLHEMGHAWVADRLGDPTPRKQGRLSFRPRDLLTHIHPIYTLALPIATLLTSGVIFGGARPVQVDPSNFKDPNRDMARVALAGPAVNFGIAFAASAVHALATAMGVGGIVPALLATTVLVNVMLGAFNLLPFFPLDGHHVVRWLVADVLKSPRAAAKLDSLGGVQLAVLVGTLVAFGGALMAGIQSIAAFLLSAPSLLFRAPSLASAVPALAAAGLLAGGRLAGRPAQPAAQASRPAVAVPAAEQEPMHTFIVRLDQGGRQLAQDMHMDFVGSFGPMADFSESKYRLTMMRQLDAAGLNSGVLHALDAKPVAIYRRINAATIQVPEPQAAAFKRTLESAGHKVYENDRREIVWPIELRPGYQKPQDFDPRARALSMPDTLKLSTMDKVHEEVRKLWGAPGKAVAAMAARGVLKLLGVDIPQPKVGVIDTGVDKEHQLVKAGLAAAKDVRPDGDGADDHGHGTWTTSMVMWFAPWLRKVTHYKAFTNGGATNDDVLKALTMAANDGNIVISNSWGDTSGDPESPDSLMVKKMAEEGRVMVFSAGNEGWSGKNTIGNPAIVHYRDPETKAPRVIAVAATDRNKKVAMFSSKGPGSQTTADNEKYKDYPRKPDAAEEGSDTEGAWPSALGPDRVDPELGPVKSISGTSMSAPKFAGTIAMLAQAFGVTKVGKDLDRIVNAVMSTLTNELDQKATSIGDGFNAAFAAYQKLKDEGMVPAGLNRIQRAALGLASWLSGYTPVKTAGEVPLQARIEHRELLKEQRSLLSELTTGVMTSGLVWVPQVVRREQIDQRMREIDRQLAALEAAHPGLALVR